MATIDLQNRAPTVVRTPDFRDVVTRRYDVLNWAPKTPADILAQCWLPLGTVDEEYTSCYLIEQSVEGQVGNFYEPCKLPPVLVRKYLQLDGLNETLVGEPAITVNQYSYLEVEYTYSQLSVGTAAFLIPGVSAAPSPYGTLILRDQKTEDDGTLRTIKRTYVQGGELSDTEELKFGGKLLLRTRKYLNEVPPTPTGYTLVTESVEYVRGLPIFSYGFASASSSIGLGGEISRGIQYNISPDQGTTGVTVTRIQYLTDLTVVANPITGPVGSELIQVDYDDRDGYRVWTGVYASGVGTITTDTDTREGGKLKIYSITAINAAPSAPSPTIGGTVTLISQRVRNGTDAAAGTVIYDYVWAEGLGEVSREERFLQSSDEGTTGVTITSIKYLSALATGSNPITPPASTILISEEYSDQNGYRVWSASYAKGTGEVSRAFTNSKGGPTAFDPANPTSSKGVVVCTIKYLTASSVTTDPTTPPANFVRFSIDHDEANGYRVWTVGFAYGNGVVQERIALRDGGLRLQSWVSFSMNAGSAAFIPNGIPITMDVDLVDGAARWDVTCMQSIDGGDPTVGVAQQFEDYVNFTYPGRAKPFTYNFPIWSVGTGFVYDVYRSPPIQIQVLADVEITYSTSPAVGSLTYPLWNPSEWATLRAFWQGTDAYAKAEVASLYGFIAAGTALAYTAPPYPNTVVIMGINALQNSSGSVAVTGGPSDPGGGTYTLAAKVEPAFVDFYGTQYYRKTIVTATIPTQPALPV